MADYNTQNDSLNHDEYYTGKIPQGLNVLTILTFIGSGLGILNSIWGFIKAKDTFDTRDKVLEQMSNGKIPSWVKSIMPDMKHFEEMVTKSYENRIPILLLSLIACALCIFGAIQMRKRMKQGFLLYTVGELLPLITSALFVGMFSLTGGIVYFTIFLSLLFIFLYYNQRKHFTK